MTDQVKRHRLDVQPAAVFPLLPGLGRIMVIVRSAGSLHERIGPLDKAEISDHSVTLSGACHAAVIDLSSLDSLHYDTSSVMKDKVLPRLDFMTASGEPGVSVVGLEGAEPFETALRQFARIPAVAPERAAAEATPPETGGDPAAPVLEALVGGDPVTIRFETASVRQQWQGKVEAVKPMSGFFNIMTPDFHLHLKAGTVASWHEADGWRHALDAEGNRTGLAIGPLA